MVMVPVIIMMNTFTMMIDSDWMVRVQVPGKEISFRQQRPAAPHLDTGSKPIFGRDCALGLSRSDPDRHRDRPHIRRGPPPTSCTDGTGKERADRPQLLGFVPWLQFVLCVLASQAVLPGVTPRRSP